MADVTVRAKGEDLGAAALVGGLAGGLASMGSGIVLGALGAVKDAVGGIVQTGFEAAASNERMELSLQSLVARELVQAGAAGSVGEAMGMASERAGELYNWTRQLAIQSPFSQEGIANAFKTALTYGFTSSEAQKLTQTLVDYAAATGASDAVTGQMANALGQIKAKGHIAGQEILQLVNAGVPALQILAEHFGKTTDEIQKMVEQGAIPADEAIAAITQSMDKDFAGAAQRQSESLSGLLNTFEDLGKLAAAELLGTSFKALAPLANQFSEWIQSEGIPALAAFGQNIGTGVGFLASLGLGLVDVANGQGLFNDNLVNAMELIPGSSGLVLGLATAVRDVLAPAFTALLEGDPLEFFTELAVAVASPEVAQGISNVATGFRSFMDDILATGPDVMTSLQNIGNTLSTAFESFAPGILDNLGTIFGELGPIISQQIEAALPVVETAVQLLSATIGGALTVVTGGVAAGLQFLSGDTDGALQTLSTSFTGFADGVVQVFGGESWSSVMATWSNNFSMAGQIVTGVMGMIGGTISGMVGQAIADIGNFAGGIASGAAAAVSGFVGGIAALPQAAITAIGDAINSAMTAAAQAAGVGQSLVSGIASGIAAGAGKAIQAAINAVQDAIAAAWAAAQGASPSKIMIGFGDEVLMAGMAVGITQGADNAVASMGSAVGNVIESAQGAAGPISVAAPLGGGGVGGGGSTEINLTVYLNTLDLSAAAEEIMDLIETAASRRGLKFSKA